MTLGAVAFIGYVALFLVRDLTAVRLPRPPAATTDRPVSKETQRIIRAAQAEAILGARRR